ncbi:hypothetical protein BJP40_14475 [Streptomyces sp. CC53]|nr:MULTISPECIES: hypothetical protein [unclassified Streptomyces]OII66110.1 hypothetical protein BJP40_14475 [Streptomyces sp. CC53]OII66473.1 hypothetical protein BJP39_28120 [Streptomyces sp. CC77]
MRVRFLFTAPALAFAALTAGAGGAAADDTPWGPFGQGNVVQREESRPVNHCGNDWTHPSGAHSGSRGGPEGNVCVNGM